MKPRFKATVALSYDLMVDGDSTGDAADQAMAIVMARPGMRASQVSSIQVTPVLVRDSRLEVQEANLAYWQESEAIRHGTAREHQLWDQAALPDHDLTRIAREVLFAPFAPIRRRVRMGTNAVHAVTSPCTGPIGWASKPCPLTQLASWELETLGKVIEIAAQASEHPWLAPSIHNFSVEARQNVGICERCSRDASDTSALVSIQWAGRTLSREYAL